MILLALLFYASYTPTQGAPAIPVDATPEEVAIQCQQFRTTSSIVYSCALTLFACTWTAVHPNLPGPDDSKAQIFLRRLKLVGVTLLAPEYTLFWAMLQRSNAKRIVEEAKGGELNIYNLSLSLLKERLECRSLSRAGALDNCPRILHRDGRVCPNRFRRKTPPPSHTRKEWDGVGRLYIPINNGETNSRS
jgi:hypothetical protein